MEKRHLIRHAAVVDPSWCAEIHTDVLGVGAVGYTVALLLAKLGVTHMRVTDTDTVAIENLGPSLYGWSDIGEPPIYKVDALAKKIRETAHVTVEPVRADARMHHSYRDVVFLALDSNDLKKEIITRFATMETGAPQWVIEGRMSSRHLMVHSFDPRCEVHRDAWMRYTLPDAEVEGSRACGAAPLSIGSVAMMTASLMGQLFIDYLQHRARRRERLTNQVYVDLDAYELQSARWEW
jgi:hypothetical protein